MTFSAARRLSTLLAAAAAFTAVAVGGQLHPAFVAVWYGGAVLAYFLPDGRLAGRYVTGTALVGFPVVVALWLRGLDVVLAAAYFASLLLLVRMMVRDGPEAHGQIHLLALVVLAGAAALSGDVTFLAAFLVFVFATTWALLLDYLHGEAGRDARGLPLAEVVGPGLASGVFALTTVALVGVAATFLLFPRTSFGLGLRRPGGAATVGLSDRVTLSAFERLRADDRVVMRVRPDGPVPWGETLPVYWRAQVLERWDGRSWTGLPRAVEFPAGPLVPLRRPEGAGRVRLEVELVADLGVAVLPVPDQALSVRLGRRDARGAPVFARPTGPGEVRPAGLPVTPYGYRLELEPARVRVDAQSPTEAHLALPPQDGRVESLAALLWSQSGADPGRFAEQVERYLSTAYRYSLELEGDDPSLEHFLFDSRAGHCEYFATAMAVLLRSRGVPARVVTGLYGGRWNDAGAYWAVRQGSAHAWVEAWREGLGWVRYDPTPPEGRSRSGTGDSLLGRLADAWDTMQAGWSRLVLDFNLRTQWQLFGHVRRALGRVGEAFGGAGPTGRGLSWALGGGILLAAVLAGLGRLRRVGPAGRPWRPSASVRRAMHLYRAVLRTLARRGIRRAPGDTPQDLLAALARQSPDDARRLGPVVARYEEARFGGRTLGADEARRLHAAVRTVGRARRAA